MAKKDSISTEAAGITKDGLRAGIAREATWEIEKLCEVLITVCPMSDDRAFFAVRGLSARISQLNEIIMNVLDGEVTTKALAYSLRMEQS